MDGNFQFDAGPTWAWNPPPEQPRPRRTVPLLRLILGFAIVGLLGVGGLWFWYETEGGLRRPEQIDQLTVDTIAYRKLLDPGEQLLAQLDTTMSLSSRESVFLTDRRLIHDRHGHATSMAWSDVARVSDPGSDWSRQRIDVHANDGRSLRIELGPLRHKGASDFRREIELRLELLRSQGAPATVEASAPDSTSLEATTPGRDVTPPTKAAAAAAVAGTAAAAATAANSPDNSTPGKTKAAKKTKKRRSKRRRRPRNKRRRRRSSS